MKLENGLINEPLFPHPTPELVQRVAVGTLLRLVPGGRAGRLGVCQRSVCGTLDPFAHFNKNSTFAFVKILFYHDPYNYFDES